MRFWRWFSEPVEQARGWYLMAIGFAILTLIDLAGRVLA